MLSEATGKCSGCLAQCMALTLLRGGAGSYLPSPPAASGSGIVPSAIFAVGDGESGIAVIAGTCLGIVGFSWVVVAVAMAEVLPSAVSVSLGLVTAVVEGAEVELGF